MIRVNLPFDIGKVALNSLYGVQKIEHPVLEIGSSYSDLKEPVRQWLNENCDKWFFNFNHDYYGIDFVNDNDATIFVMKWL